MKLSLETNYDIALLAHVKTLMIARNVWVLNDGTMKKPRCTKCKYFHRTRAKTRIYDHGQGISMVAPSLADSLGTYLCHNRWWNVSSLKEIKEGDVCEDFEFKTKRQ